MVDILVAAIFAIVVMVIPLLLYFYVPSTRRVLSILWTGWIGFMAFIFAPLAFHSYVMSTTAYLTGEPIELWRVFLAPVMLVFVPFWMYTGAKYFRERLDR